MFITKTNPSAPALIKTGLGTLSVKAGTVLCDCSGVIANFTVDTAVTMPSTLSVGDDIAVWLDSCGVLVSNKDYTTAPSAGAKLIGGAHYAGGSNGSNAQSGGNTTPQISEFSLWDIGYRPACPNPSAMVCVNGAFWVDIYLANANYPTGGTSVNGADIANDIQRPIRPLTCGGNGTARMVMSWWAANELVQACGKRLMSYAEFCVAAFGVTEYASRGNAAGSAGLSTHNTGSSNPDEAFTSRWGVIQATGCYWIWGSDVMYSLGTSYNGSTYQPSLTPQYYNITEGRGKMVQDDQRSTRPVLMGGKYNLTTESGSRCLDFVDAVQEASLTISTRGAADHFQSSW